MLIVFSGLDGAGKSTQIKLLEERLLAAGQRPITLWTRGGYTPGFNTLKAALRRFSRSRVVPPPGINPQRAEAFSRPAIRRLWLSLALLDLFWVYAVRVRSTLWRNRIVICDRYLLDTSIDFGLNFPKEDVARWWLWRALTRFSPRPQATFLLLVPVDVSAHRSEQKGVPFQDPPELLHQRLARYQEYADRSDCLVLDGRRAVNDLASEIWDRVVPIIPEQQPQPA